MNEKAFWNRIKALLKQKGVTQDTAARACGININTWRGWVSKNIIPGLEDSAAIAKYLNVSLNFLVRGKERNSQAKIAEIQLLLKRANSKLSTLK